MGDEKGPLDDVLPKIRERLQKTAGHSVKEVTANHVLIKWLKQKNILVVTLVDPNDVYFTPH